MNAASPRIPAKPGPLETIGRGSFVWARAVYCADGRRLQLLSCGDLARLRHHAGRHPQCAAPRWPAYFLVFIAVEAGLSVAGNITDPHRRRRSPMVPKCWSPACCCRAIASG